jgi:putative selenate reductase
LREERGSTWPADGEACDLFACSFADDGAFCGGAAGIEERMMSDVMRPIPFGELVRRIFGEYRKDGAVFGIPGSKFFRKRNTKRIEILGTSCDTPLGPAAGPHTQLAQNIVSAYLAGGRFFERKTVQKLDRLKVSKPCIEAADEGYNCEWSSEFTLEKAYDEYLKAWVLLHLLEEAFDLRTTGARTFLFNMSVGYDLDGIRTAKMDAFISRMLDSSHETRFDRYLGEAEALARDVVWLKQSGLESKGEDLARLSGKISPCLSPSVTLSTMHGCPPAEIEAICRYFLTEKKIHTFVKLNPTLLGYKTVTETLRSLGFIDLTLREESFRKDLRYEDAVAMLRRLQGTAEQGGCVFGVKLTNTLAAVNHKNYLPDKEMYMSGRALYPLAIRLAAKLAREFSGLLPISYCGGAAQWNVREILATGIRPITVVTDLLKPGGYLRMAEMASLLEDSPGWECASIDPVRLTRLAEEAAGKVKYTQKQWRGMDTAVIRRKLPLLDCYAAPCARACPIGQDVPQYIRLVGEKRFGEALALIYAKNPLPHITGHICDHPCMAHCTRLDYDDPVEIREVKRVAAEMGWEAYRERRGNTPARSEARVAVIGAGPTGLAAASFLGRAGLRVTVFEKRDSAGGVVKHVIPRFRLPAEAVERDVQLIAAGGVEFRFHSPAPFDIDLLKKQGFKYIFISIGAEAGLPLELPGGNSNVLGALDFLARFHMAPEKAELGRRVVVVGGGNTAMDSARAALRVKGVDVVTVIYRRTLKEMPADREEVENCRREGVRFKFLANPESFSVDGTLVCRKMELGEPDASGRKRPMPTGESENLKADTVIAAIGEQVDRQSLLDAGLRLENSGWPAVDGETGETDKENVFIGGDAHTGPSTVVRCIAEARKVAETICRKESKGWGEYSQDSYTGPVFDEGVQRAEIFRKKAVLGEAQSPASLGGDRAFGIREAERCLECQAVCNKCVDVCPNRANVAIEAPGVGTQKYQILHLDAFCNECGNCATFCPYTIDGRPYKDKLTLFSLEEDFAESESSGFLIQGKAERTEVKLRLAGRLYHLPMEDDEIALPAECGGNLELKAAARLIGNVYREYRFLLGPVDR